MAENIFEGLAEFYDEQVKKNDEDGYSEAFKNATESFFKTVSEDIYEYDGLSINFEDIQYLDGYYIFGFGTNSVIHFHIKECPNWLFGIWWDATEDCGKDNNRVHVTGKLFTQYEKEIDKFKPTNCDMCTTINVYGDNTCSCWDARNMIKFIVNEPYLAFCRFWHGWNYNQEYHSREEAQEMFKRYVANKAKKKKYTAICDEKLLTFMREKVVSLLKEGDIEDRGECWYPRYQLIAPYENYADVVESAGCYGVFDIIEDDKFDAELANKLFDEFEQVIKECEEIAEEHDIYWHKPIEDDIILYDELKKE